MNLLPGKSLVYQTKIGPNGSIFFCVNLNSWVPFSVVLERGLGKIVPSTPTPPNERRTLLDKAVIMVPHSDILLFQFKVIRLHFLWQI